MNRKKRLNRKGIYFLLPSMICASLFVVLPYINIIARSFEINNGVQNLKIFHYQEVLHNQAFRLGIRNTGVFLGCSIPLLILLSLLIGYGIFTCIKKSGWIKTSLLIPLLLPTVSVVILWRFCFHEYGILNKVLGYPIGKGIDWLNSEYGMLVLIIGFVWQNIGCMILLWIAGMRQISFDVFEAGKIDGAGHIQCFIYIVCPQLVEYFISILILCVINGFKIYRQIYLLTGDYPNEGIYMLQNLFNNWFRNLKLADMSAAAILILIPVIILVFFVDKIRIGVRK